MFYENIALQPIQTQTDINLATASPYIRTRILPMSSLSHDVYDRRPIELSAYIQDKLEFKRLHPEHRPAVRLLRAGRACAERRTSRSERSAPLHLYRGRPEHLLPDQAGEQGAHPGTAPGVLVPEVPRRSRSSAPGSGAPSRSRDAAWSTSRTGISSRCRGSNGSTRTRISSSGPGRGTRGSSAMPTSSPSRRSTARSACSSSSARHLGRCHRLSARHPQSDRDAGRTRSSCSAEPRSTAST